MTRLCFCCERALPINDAAATFFRGHPGWGSGMDGSTGGTEPLQIAICDDCLIQRGDRVELRRTETSETHTTRAWLCPDCLKPRYCGRCPHCETPVRAAE